MEKGIYWACLSLDLQNIAFRCPVFEHLQVNQEDQKHSKYVEVGAVAKKESRRGREGSRGIRQPRPGQAARLASRMTDGRFKTEHPKSPETRWVFFFFPIRVGIEFQESEWYKWAWLKRGQRVGRRG